MTYRSKWSPQAKKTLAYQQHVANYAIQQLPQFGSMYLGISLKAWLKSPKARPGDLPQARPDYTNILKSIEDGIQFSGKVPNDKRFIRFGQGGFYPCKTAEEEHIEVKLWEVDISEIQA